ncbi:MAG: PEP-CTERM sorting domain-containing protein [Candidatus Nealsonbacteria bacterium]|nr:PEP-CTERM sorting domain-containing protein [Candidatus Nealsonbacteria bacterium]
MARRSSIVTWCVALGLLTATSAARATIILHDPQPAKHDRFYVGDDKAFIGDPYDFSGAGRVDLTGNSARWVTMISPSYFLSASHWHPADGATVKFHYTNDPDGAAELRTIESGVQIGVSDVWLGKLSSPVSSSVAKYPLLELGGNWNYNDLEILTFGLTVARSLGTATTVRLGRNEINPNEYGTDPPTGGKYYRYEFDDPGLGDDESYLQTGDSGGPSFNIYNGQPALTGIHWFIDDEGEPRDYSGDSFIKPYVADIQAAMIGERPTLLPTPPNAWTWGNQGGAGDSRWATAANWEPDQIPGLLSVATIGNGDTVTLDTGGQSDEVVLNHGLLHVTGAGTLTVDNIVEVGPASRLTVDGLLTAATVSVHGTLAGGGTVHAGLIDVLQMAAPGNNDIGTLTVGNGEMQLTPSATYEAELSLAPSDARADVIEVSLDGTLQLGGTLAPRGVGRTDANDWASGVIRRVVNSPDGTIGNTTSGTGLTFDQIAPAPAATAASHIGQGAFLRDVYYVTDDEPEATPGVDVELFVALGGDADGDGKVWLSDWASLRANFGNTGTDMTWIDGNFDPWTDDKVWLSDWASLRANFSNQGYTVAQSGGDLYGDVDWGEQTTLQTTPGSSAATEWSVGRVVPEPGTLAMLLAAGLLGVGIARKKCRMKNDE